MSGTIIGFAENETRGHRDINLTGKHGERRGVCQAWFSVTVSGRRGFYTHVALTLRRSLKQMPQRSPVVFRRSPNRRFGYFPALAAASFASIAFQFTVPHHASM